MKPTRQILPQSFYQRDTPNVARNLLGCRLYSRIGRRLTSGIIVETEAYLPEHDPACHATRGETRSNGSMFGAAGRAYVYPIHAGFCFNVVTEDTNVGCAVLIRALQPVDGVQTMQQRRNTEDPRKLTTGPSRMCQSLSFDRAIDGWDLTQGRRVWIESRAEKLKFNSIMTTPRIGVTSAHDLKLRFVIANNSFVSGPKRDRCR